MPDEPMTPDEMVRFERELVQDGGAKPARPGPASDSQDATHAPAEAPVSIPPNPS